MVIRYYDQFEQGSQQWLAARCGLLTASEIKHIITPKKLVYASNDKERAHLYELAAQRVTKYVEPHYIGDDMLRGEIDEIHAREAYSQKYERVQQVGFVTNDKWGFTLGFSPDGLVGHYGLIEVKSRRQKFQLQTIADGVMPEEYLLQVQTGLLVSERKWCDFISYCGGMPMVTLRVWRDDDIQDAIVSAAATFHEKLAWQIDKYNARLVSSEMRLIPTERQIEQEMIV